MPSQHRPSPSLVIAFLALVIAVVGASAGVYAAAKIDGSQLKPKSVPGKALKKDTLTGKQIKESKLKGLASSSDFKRISLHVETSTLKVSPLLDMGTIHLSFQCSPGPGGIWKLLASSDGEQKKYDMLFTQGGGSGDGPSETRGGLTALSATNILGNSNPPNTDFSRIVGTIVFNDGENEETISVTFAINIDRQDPQLRCDISGTAVRARG